MDSMGLGDASVRAFSRRCVTRFWEQIRGRRRGPETGARKVTKRSQFQGDRVEGRTSINATIIATINATINAKGQDRDGGGPALSRLMVARRRESNARRGRRNRLKTRGEFRRQGW